MSRPPRLTLGEGATSRHSLDYSGHCERTPIVKNMRALFGSRSGVPQWRRAIVATPDFGAWRPIFSSRVCNEKFGQNLFGDEPPAGDLVGRSHVSFCGVRGCQKCERYSGGAGIRGQDVLPLPYCPVAADPGATFPPFWPVFRRDREGRQSSAGSLARIPSFHAQ